MSFPAAASRSFNKREILWSVSLNWLTGHPDAFSREFSATLRRIQPRFISMVIKKSSAAEKTGFLLWMIPVQLLLLAAWAFNLFALGAILADCWKAEQFEKVFGIGVLFVWLLCAGWIILRTTIRRPSAAEA